MLPPVTHRDLISYIFIPTTEFENLQGVRSGLSLLRERETEFNTTKPG